MRAPCDDRTKTEIRAFYERLQELLDERSLKWSELALLLDLSPKTLSSMKSQLVNPSFTTVRRIATALDVSLDELTADDSKAEELYDLYWAIPRYISNRDIQSLSCRQMMAITNATAGLDTSSPPDRIGTTTRELQEKLKKLRK